MAMPSLRVDEYQIIPEEDESPDRLIRLMDQWNPDSRPQHCANCRHAIIQGPRLEPEVRCLEGRGRTHGRAQPLGRLLRTHTPFAWRTASECPGFVSMSD